MSFLLAHPELAGRTCDECRKWVYQDAGERLSGKKQLLPDGHPMPRVVPDSMPCRVCPKIPIGGVPPGETAGPQHAVELSPKNEQAYWHYQECRAVGQFPDDPLVRRNAAIIRMVEDDIEQERSNWMPLLLMLRGR